MQLIGFAHGCLQRTRSTCRPPSDGLKNGLAGSEKRARVEIDGSILQVESARAVIEKFYFDGPGAEDWPALAHYNGALVPALSDAYMFVPAR